MIWAFRCNNQRMATASIPTQEKSATTDSTITFWPVSHLHTVQGAQVEMEDKVHSPISSKKKREMTFSRLRLFTEVCLWCPQRTALTALQPLTWLTKQWVRMKKFSNLAGWMHKKKRNTLQKFTMLMPVRWLQMLSIKILKCQIASTNDSWKH